MTLLRGGLMDKIIIYGMGEDFTKNREKIIALFEVIGCTDSYRKPSDEWEKQYFINPETLSEKRFDKILICSSRYRDAIKIGLIKDGIDAGKILSLNDVDDIRKRSSSRWLEVINDMEKYTEKNRDERFTIRDESLFLIEDEKECEAGEPGTHYFAQDIWGARKIYENNPLNHYDIGSSLNGFIAHLLVFRKVNYIDVRPLKRAIPGLQYLYGDAMNLKNIESDSIDSLSSFHAMEHFGLGRYGDPVDPEGYIKGAKSMQRVLQKSGRLYLGVPVGPEDKLVFNAHRIFTIETVIRLFDKCNLKDIAIVEPDGIYAHPIQEKDYDNIKDFSCGLFEFEKI